MSIRLRLTLWYSGILTVTLVLFGVALYLFLSIRLYGDLQHQLREQGMQVISQTQRLLVPTREGFRIVYTLPPLDAFQSADIFLQVLDASGGKGNKSSNLGQWDLPVADMAKVLAAEEPFFEKGRISNVSLFIYNHPLEVDNQLAGILRVAVKKDHIDNSLSSLQYILFLAGVLTIGLAASIGWFLARKTLRPIDHVIAAANLIQKGADLDNRIVYDGPKDEIGRLTETINGMLSRIQMMYTELDEAYRAQRRFVSDASHELRTPLTTIRGNVELLEKMWTAAEQRAARQGEQTEEMALSLEAMRDIAAEAQRMSRMVNDLLSLARADAGQQMQMEPVAMEPLVVEVVRKAQLLPRHAEWQTGSIEALDGACVHGNSDYLQQLLFIFIDNAFKYTEQGVVVLDALRADGMLGLRIQDTGIGMDEAEVPLVFERFYRADVSRGKTAGTGLGLSIAKWIIDEHRGSIEVATMKGEGTTFVIWLPLAELALSTGDQILAEAESKSKSEESPGALPERTEGDSQ